MSTLYLPTSIARNTEPLCGAIQNAETPPRLMLLAPSWIEKKCWSVVCWIVNPFPFSKSIGYVSILMPIQGRRNGLLQRAFYQEQESPQALWHPVPQLPNQPYPPAPSPPCPILQTAPSPLCVTCPVLPCLIFYYRQYTGHV